MAGRCTAALRRQMITREELEAKLREQGVESIAKVGVARIESDGQLSVSTYADDKQDKPRQPPPPYRQRGRQVAAASTAVSGWLDAWRSSIRYSSTPAQRQR